MSASEVRSRLRSWPQRLGLVSALVFNPLVSALAFNPWPRSLYASLTCLVKTNCSCELPAGVVLCLCWNELPAQTTPVAGSCFHCMLPSAAHGSSLTSSHHSLFNTAQHSQYHLQIFTGHKPPPTQLNSAKFLQLPNICKILLTRNSAIADKPCDAFRGQSRSPNMVLFVDMLGMVSY